jgi:tyrosine-protein phosphatase YwqE
MKTVLVPTDFNLQSLNCISKLTEHYYPEQLNIIMVHMMKITDSYSELLMLSRRSAEYEHVSQEFYDECIALKQKYADKISNIRIEFFYGSTVSVFKNFLDANDVDAIIMLNDYNYKLLNKFSIEPASLVNRSGKQIVFADYKPAPTPLIQQTKEYLVEQKV